MRILHVTDTYLPRLGGIELHVSDLSARQRRAGHHLLVLTAEQESIPGRGTCRESAVPVLRIGGGIAGLGIGGRLTRAIDAFAPDVIHAHLTVGSPFAWAMLRRRGDIPTIATMHSLLPRSPRLIRAGVRLAGIDPAGCSLAAVSEVAAARLRPALGADQSVRILHNGIDPAFWSEPHVASDRFTILVVGRLEARKRPLQMVDAFADLARSAPDLDWQATFVGDGSYRSRVESAIRRHGLGARVRLQGALDRAGIRGMLASADAFVAPAMLESFGIAALEARCAGVPVIGMADSGIREFIEHRVNGLLASSDRDLSRCLHQLAREPGLARAIREHNLTHRVPMSWSDVVREHHIAYEAAVEAHRRPPVRTGSTDRRAGTSR